jgi:hypothetical protein
MKKMRKVADDVVFNQPSDFSIESFIIKNPKKLTNGNYKGTVCVTSEWSFNPHLGDVVMIFGKYTDMSDIKDIIKSNEGDTFFMTSTSTFIDINSVSDAVEIKTVEVEPSKVTKIPIDNNIRFPERLKGAKTPKEKAILKTYHNTRTYEREKDLDPRLKSLLDGIEYNRIKRKSSFDLRKIVNDFKETYTNPELNKMLNHDFILSKLNARNQDKRWAIQDFAKGLME